MHTRTILAAIAAMPAAAGAGNLVANGDLELPLAAPSGTDTTVAWTLIEPSVDAAGAPVSSATFASFANHTPGGDRGLWLQSFEGGLGGDAPFLVDASLVQTVPAQTGLEYTLSAWFRYEANYTSQATLLRMEFLNAGMGVISSASININFLNPKDNVWREFSVAATPPPGVAFVRCRMDMIGGQHSPLNPQSAFVDDFELTAAPLCEGDTNGDGAVDSLDLNIVLANFGCIGFACPGDINASGNVNSQDLNIILAGFGCQP